MDSDVHLRHLADDIEAVASAVETGPADAPIAGCPGWNLVDLGQHLGFIHRWARHAVLTGTPLREELPDPAPSEPSALAAWLRSGGDDLLAALRAIDPDAPTWHPFPVPRVAAVWPRRQAQEASVHRWDAQHAIGMDATIDADHAADGIDEYFGVMLRRLVQRARLVVPPSVFAAECTDTGDRWVVHGVDEDIEPATGLEPQATVRGPAQWVLLRLWGRPVPSGSAVVVGDPVVAAAWLALGGV
jgi:uncharacterized protein (TIGR03083 family)